MSSIDFAVGNIRMAMPAKGVAGTGNAMRGLLISPWPHIVARGRLSYAMDVLAFSLDLASLYITSILMTLHLEDRG